MIKHILLDQDGVLADFHSAALRAHGRADLSPVWPKGEWAMERPLGITPKQFWAPIDNYQFWMNHVVPYPGAADFYQNLGMFADVVICTSPSESSDCVKAKLDWLREYIDPKVKYMLGSHKHLMATPSNLLVDDYDRNVDKFRASGGRAVLVPRVWNSNHSVIAPDPYKWTLVEVSRELD